MDEANTAQGQETGFNVILLATDGSEFGHGTERVTLEVAAQHQSHLFVLRLLLAEADTPEADTEKTEATAHLDKLATLCAERGIQCTTLLRPGDDPSDGILDAAKEVLADLVVVGRRGRRGLARFKVGDATAKVIERAACKVLVVPRLVTIWSSGILLVTEPPQTGDAAAEAACHLARAADLPLTILMVTEEGESDADRREANQLVNRLVAIAKQQDIDAAGVVQAGKLDEVALELARQRSADLLVSTYREEQSFMEKLFKTHPIIHLIGQAHSPVMVVK